MICRHAPQGGVGDSVSATTMICVNERCPSDNAFEDRHSLGADGQTVARILDVAAGDDAAVGGFERGAHLEAGEVCHRMVSGGTCGVRELRDVQ